MTAGFGTRLSPLTHFIPKPLLPLEGPPLVGHTLGQLQRLGCEVTVLNLHHLGDQIRYRLGQSWHGMPLVYSPEEEIQGTLGALHPCREILGRSDAVILVNGDSYCQWPWRALIRRHLNTDADATLLVHRRAPEESLGGGVGLDPKGRVVGLRDSEVGAVHSRHLFAGAHILSPRVLERIEAGFADIIADLYIPLMQEGKTISSVVTNRRWYDLGTPDRYLETHLASTRGGWLRRRRRNMISPLAETADDALVRGSLLASGSTVGATAEVTESVVLENARIPAGSRVHQCILGPGVILPPSTNVERRMINRVETGRPTGAGATVMGDLVYTPLTVES